MTTPLVLLCSTCEQPINFVEYTYGNGSATNQPCGCPGGVLTTTPANPPKRHLRIVRD